MGCAAPPPPFTSSFGFHQSAGMFSSTPTTTSSGFTFGASSNCPPPPAASSFGFHQSTGTFSSKPTTASSGFLFGSNNSSEVNQQSSLFSFANANPFSSSIINEQKSWPSNDQDVVRHLTNLQKYDGLWNLSNDDIENLCQKPLTSFQSNLTNDSTILTTVIVIVILEMK